MLSDDAYSSAGVTCWFRRPAWLRLAPSACCQHGSAGASAACNTHCRPPLWWRRVSRRAPTSHQLHHKYRLPANAPARPPLSAYRQ
ncbi:hypothetical protein KCP77_00375 [Salmonella enterica subsp. enterica]|nr:hypothetical protein KCP77_00375 [Salmonella enterica subsp. enterica]